MAPSYEREFRQTASWQEARHRQNVDDEFEPPQQGTAFTEKQALLAKLLSLFTRVSEDVMRGVVIGMIAATPCLRRLFWRIVLGAALTGAVLAVLIICWVASLARA